MVELLHDVGLFQELLRHAGVRLHLAGLHGDVGALGYRGGWPVNAAMNVAELSLADDFTQFYSGPETIQSGEHSGNMKEDDRTSQI